MKLNFPGFQADLTITRAPSETNNLTALVMRKRRSSFSLIKKSDQTVLPASACDHVDCDWVQHFCYASLDLDPVTCGLFYGCCNGAGKTDGSECRTNPCDPGCSAEGCIQSMLIQNQSALTSSAELSTLSSQLASMKRQLNRIELCTCGPTTLTYHGPNSSVIKISPDRYRQPLIPVPVSPSIYSKRY